MIVLGTRLDPSIDAAADDDLDLAVQKTMSQRVRRPCTLVDPVPMK
jgi:hypothetical protein